jgi:hypothetical protein
MKSTFGSIILLGTFLSLVKASSWVRATQQTNATAPMPVSTKPEVAPTLISKNYYDDTIAIMKPLVINGIYNLASGATNTYQCTVFQEANRTQAVGTATYACTNTVTPKAICQGILNFNASSLSVHGIVDISSTSSVAFAIVGGTGLFMGANGEIKGSLGGEVGLDMVATFNVLKEATLSNTTDQKF